MRTSRRGESDECFDLVKLSASERATFIVRARTVAAGDRQRFLENARCENDRD